VFFSCWAVVKELVAFLLINGLCRHPGIDRAIFNHSLDRLLAMAKPANRTGKRLIPQAGGFALYLFRFVGLA
jgi:hypothetical protein